METFLILSAFLLCCLGIAGCFIPGLPGPPLSYLGMLLLQKVIAPFSISTLIVWGIVTLVVVILDYYLPIWTSKKPGATKTGIIGSIVGMTAGIFFTPIGMIAGMIIGSIAGDLIAGSYAKQALRSGIGLAFGTLVTIGFKLIASGIIFLLVIAEIVQYWI